MEAILLLIVLTFCVYVVRRFGYAAYLDYKRNRVKEAPAEETPEFIPAEHYSKDFADSCISDDDYRYPNCRNRVATALSSTCELSALLEMLFGIVNESEGNSKTVPESTKNWFFHNAMNFIKYGEIMAVIEHYPLLEDLFLDNLPKSNESSDWPIPAENLELQKCLISVCIAGEWRVNYVNLLCKFLVKYDLLPEVKAVVFCDYRFERVYNIYKLYRPKTK